MSTILYISILLAVCATLASPALVFAKRFGVLSFAEIALPLAPVISLLIGLQLLNSAANIGYAFIVYPILCMAFSVVLLYVRVFALKRVKVRPVSLSVWMLVITCMLAFAFGALLPPWYE